MSKIIQISAVLEPPALAATVYALDENGEIWFLHPDAAKWHPLPKPPVKSETE